MKPPKFEYHAPRTVDEALALLGRYGGDAKVLAGGQSLVPLLNFRLARPAALIDLNRIPALAGIREVDGHIAFGAMTRQRAVEFSPLVARQLPLLAEATRWVGHLPIRSRGTIGRWTARLATAGTGPVPVRLRGAEEIIGRDGIGDAAVAAAAARAAELVRPDGDLHASADYRRNLTRVLTERALRKAIGRAR